MVVTIAAGHLRPAGREIAFGFRSCSVRVCFEEGCALAPDTDVGVLAFDPFDKTVVVVTLTVPHSHLDIPVEETDFILGFFSGQENDNRDNKQQNRKEFKESFHSFSYLRSTSIGRWSEG